MNKSQFPKWQKVVRRSLDKLNLNDYEIYFHYEKINADLPDGEEIIGYCECNHENRWANLILNSAFSGKLTQAELDRNAKHEALELRFNIIRRMLEQYYAVDLVDGEIHKLIRVFEKII